MTCCSRVVIHKPALARDRAGYCADPRNAEFWREPRKSDLPVRSTEKTYYTTADRNFAFNIVLQSSRIAWIVWRHHQVVQVFSANPCPC